MSFIFYLIFIFNFYIKTKNKKIRINDIIFNSVTNQELLKVAKRTNEFSFKNFYSSAFEIFCYFLIIDSGIMKYLVMNI